MGMKDSLMYSVVWDVDREAMASRSPVGGRSRDHGRRHQRHRRNPRDHIAARYRHQRFAARGMVGPWPPKVRKDILQWVPPAADREQAVGENELRAY